jgi:translation initiation factor 3 subunit F
VEPVAELAQVSEASVNVLSMLDTVLNYVNEILAGRSISPQDNAVGRALLDMVNSVPKMTPDEFENMLNSNIKDLLMVICLSQLTKTQIQLNEKLTLLTTL